MEYTYHQDPGHGWIQVTRSELIELGILQDISGYSYEDRRKWTGGVEHDDVYLEEDCDASRFIDAYKNKYGVAPTLVDKYHKTPVCPIRCMQGFMP